MRVAFVQFLFYECLGVMYLSSSLKKHGHSVEVFICPEGKGKAGFIEEVIRYQPDVIAFSFVTGSEGPALYIAEQIRKRLKVYSIFGGPHPTFVPEIIEKDGVDCVCIGESEQSLVAIADILAAGNIPEKVPGAWFKIRGEITRNDIGAVEHDLDRLSRPDRSLYRGRYRSMRSRRAGFITGRGCPYKCSFCASPALAELYRTQGACYVRQRSVKDVIDEIREVVTGYDIETVYFEDDTFIIKKEWVLEFCDSYQREIGLPFSCHIRADLADEKVIAALSRANCRTVAFGIETGNQEKRRLLLNKKVTDEQIIGCAGMLKKYGIRVRTLNIVGLPGETLEEAFQTVTLNRRVKPDFPWCSIFQPLPATELWAYCEKHALFEGGTARTRPSFFKDSPLLLKDKKRILNLHKLFFYAVKFPALQGVIRRALRAEPNVIYELFFALAQAWMFLKSERVSIKELINIGSRNISRYLPGGRGNDE